MISSEDWMLFHCRGARVQSWSGTKRSHTARGTAEKKKKEISMFFLYEIKSCSRGWQVTQRKNLPNGDESLPQEGQERRGMPPLSSDGPQNQAEMCVRAESLGRFVGEALPPV